MPEDPGRACFPPSLRIYVLNLEEEPIRRRWMEQQCHHLRLPFTRISAYHGDHIPPHLLSRFYKSCGTPYGPLSAGEIGCYASHLQAMQHLVEDSQADYALILEDDVYLKPQLLSFLRNIPKLPSDWEIIRLQNVPKHAFLTHGQITDGLELITYWRIPPSAGAYLIHTRGAKKYLSRTKPCTRAIGIELRYVWQHHLRTYGILPLVTDVAFPDTAPSVPSMPSAINRLSDLDSPRGRLEPVRSFHPLYYLQKWHYNYKLLKFWGFFISFYLNFKVFILRNLGQTDWQKHLRFSLPPSVRKQRAGLWRLLFHNHPGLSS